jgi:sugar/nucleoside kinase (ribokinase family)
MFDLLVVGDANPDVIVGPVDGPLAFGQRERLVSSGALTIGGSAAITACGAARLGLSVAFAGRVGDDDAGHYLRTALADRGVNTDALTTDPDLPTPLTVVLTRGDDRAMLTAPGVLAATTACDVPPDLVAAVRHVHVASYFLMPQLARSLPCLLQLAHRHGATTSLDTNDDPAGEWAGVADVLSHVDILLPNAAEALHLAPAPTVAEAAASLAALGPLVAVKDGVAGALCHTGTELLHTKGIAVSPVDSVGAGDTFDAGFLAGVLRGLPTATALDLAAVCGALSTLDRGGTACQPTWADAMSHLPLDGEAPA